MRGKMRGYIGMGIKIRNKNIFTCGVSGWLGEASTPLGTASSSIVSTGAPSSEAGLPFGGAFSLSPGAVCNGTSDRPLSSSNEASLVGSSSCSCKTSSSSAGMDKSVKLVSSVRILKLVPLEQECPLSPSRTQLNDAPQSPHFVPGET